MPELSKQLMQPTDTHAGFLLSDRAESVDLLLLLLLVQVCCYLAEDEQADVAVEQAEQLMQLTDIQSSDVVELEGPAVKKQKVVAGTAVHNSQGSGGSVPCAAVVGAAAAVAAAAVAVGFAYLNMG